MSNKLWYKVMCNSEPDKEKYVVYEREKKHLLKADLEITFCACSCEQIFIVPAQIHL